GYWSKRIAFRQHHESAEQIFNELLDGHNDWRARAQIAKDSYLILAMDLETFGHHQKDGVTNFITPFLAKLLEHKDTVRTTPLNEIHEKFPKIDKTDIFIPASWSTEKEHLDQGIPYPLWDHPANPFHRLWNGFARLAHHRTELAPNYSAELAELMRKSFYSCPPWQFAHGNKEVAGWCIPHFERIAHLLNNDRELYQIIWQLKQLVK
ncbi:MAG: hypothetical protein AAB930_00485, partial [Patescibacteria group bacterium]